MKPLPFRHFSAEENGVWKELFETQALKRDIQIVPIFSAGIRAIGMTSDRVPDLAQINTRLRKLTGFEGVPVEGLVADADFFGMLAQRKFPVGNFIRDRRDLSYTPAPDVFHDLYGHLPFLADTDYADFSARFGALGWSLRMDPTAITRLSRFFWFTLEFGLIQTPQGRRIFGGGIASSVGECAYALGAEPTVAPFDIQAICARPYKIDEFQKHLFLLQDTAQLYGCLPALAAYSEQSTRF